MRWKSTVSSAVLLAAGLLAVASAQQVSDGANQFPTISPRQENPLSDEDRADIFMARKMYREAAELYLKVAGRLPILWNKAGIAYHQMGDLDTAKKHYDRAVKLNPEYAEALNNLGALWYAKRNYRRAISYYKKALKHMPDSASMHSNLGTAHFARKKYNDAFKEYELALSLDPDVFEHRSTHGVLLQERSVEERAKFNFYLAKTYAKAGMSERALLYIRKALEFGFKDKSKFFEDDDFSGLRELPEFEALMKLEPRVL